MNKRVIAVLTCLGGLLAAGIHGQSEPSPDIVLRAATAQPAAGAWTVLGDSRASLGSALWLADAGVAKLASASASPRDYFEKNFTVRGGVPYRLWIRGRAQNDSWMNDSAFVQFSGSVAADGTPAFRIGTTSATVVSLEECSGCGVSGWGWQDNGYGAGVLGPAVYFQTTGPQRLRVQTREDGYGLDQIVLSPSRYASTPPGALRNDTTILTPSGGQ